MKLLIALLAAVLMMAGLPQHAKAEVVLNDWCVNVNGDSGTVCNNPYVGPTVATSGASSIDVSAFDYTLSPGANTLGTITVTLGAAGYASVYMDYDIDFAGYGSFQDYGTVGIGAPPGFGWELDDPNVSNIFPDFAANTLANTNNVGTAVIPATPPVTICCDVSWALGVGGLSSGSTVTFSVSDTAPGGFYLQQTNADTGDSIYLSAAVTSPLSSVPEPSTLILLIPVGAVLAIRKKFQAAR